MKIKELKSISSYFLSTLPKFNLGQIAGYEIPTSL